MKPAKIKKTDIQAWARKAAENDPAKKVGEFFLAGKAYWPRNGGPGPYCRPCMEHSQLPVRLNICSKAPFLETYACPKCGKKVTVFGL